MTTPNEQQQAHDLKVGDRARFHPKPGHGWWTVRARDERYIVCTRQAPFKPKGEQQYTILDLTGYQERTYNGAGNGIVRSSLNTLGGGYDLGEDGANCGQILKDLASGEWELSHRRIVSVWRIEVKR